MADRNGYIGRAPGDSSVIIARKTYEPTGVQTDFTFSAGYTPGYCDVYLNGVKLIDATDYTATGGSVVGLTSAANSGDILEIVAYKAFNLGIPLSNVTGNLDVTGNISASSSITADGSFYGDGSNLSNIAGTGITQYIAANSLTVIGSPGVSTITRLGVTDAVVTGIITANGLSGNVTGAAATFTTGTFNGNVTIGGTLTYEDVTNIDSLGIVTARAGVNVSGGQLTVGAAYSVGYAGVVTAQNVTISAGTIDLKNSGSVSNIKFYCESANAHYTALQSAAHSAYGGNVTLTLPTTTDTLIGKTTTDTLTNKTLTSPTLTTPVFSGAATGELKVGSGITMAATSGVVTFADGSTTTNALHFGSGGDLKVYHNGSNSFIQDTGTGSLFIDGTIVYLRNPAGDEHLANFHSDGAANLYYNGSLTFSTTDDGTTTTGIATATGGLSINADSKNLTIGASEDLKLFHDGSHSVIHDDGTGALKFVSANSFQFRDTDKDTGDYCINANIDGAVSLYHNGTKTFETTSVGAAITSLAHDGGLTISAGSNNQSTSLNIKAKASGGTEYTGRIEVARGNGAISMSDGSNTYISMDSIGVRLSGIVTASAGVAYTGLLREAFAKTGGKLSDNTNIDLEDGMVHYFTTQESTTSTPNLRWNSSFSLANKMNVNDAITVTIITTAAAGGYSANLTIDGNAVTEQWVGGEAPSEGGSDGYDIYTYNILKIGTGTGDSGFFVIGHVVNAT